jgi:hypothetical protein
MKASDLDKIFDDGEEDILPYLDLSKVQVIDVDPKRVNVDFPKWMVTSLDREADRLGVTRQSLIKMWIAEKLDRTTPPTS